MTDLILDSAAAGQFVAVTDGNYDGRLEEKRISSLQNKTNVTNQWLKDRCVKGSSTENMLEFICIVVKVWDLNEDRGSYHIYMLQCFPLGMSVKVDFHHYKIREDLCLYPRFNIGTSSRTTTWFFTTPTCHTDKVKLEQHCIYHSASAPWDLVKRLRKTSGQPGFCQQTFSTVNPHCRGFSKADLP